MNSFTFLKLNQIFRNTYAESYRLEIFKKMGYKANITDFSILLGGYGGEYNFFIKDKKTYVSIKGNWWTQTESSADLEKVVVIETNGANTSKPISLRNVGARPAIAYSLIDGKWFCDSEKRGVKHVEYGYYPQTVVNKTFASHLEVWYNNKVLKETEMVYTTDSVYYDNKNVPFKLRKFKEYEFNNKRYIRFVGDSNCVGQTLSDGRIVEEGEVYWVEVEPIVWLVDEKNDIAVSEKIIFAGIQFNKGDYKGNFDETNIKKFMDDYFSKEIIGVVAQEKIVEEPFDTRRQNPYDFNFDNVSEEEIIRSAIESNVAVFLHGRSSEGKSARVKQIDPDCEIIYLRNATPDSLNGKSVYNESKGEMIDVPPSWYKKMKAKCEAEPDKLHILFFDEITNALPSIQGMAFNIILDKEVNGVWKLPDNCRIVAAGNDLNDSLAANTLAEPLFNRFAHVYIETKVNDWLKWAIDNKIHPSIYAFVAYKGEKVLRSKYDGEKPNADPRKWELASKVLYTSKNPNMLRALVGEEITKDFVEFCKQQVITVEDVVSGNYSEADLKMNLAEKYATVVGLSSASEKDVEVVREFVGKLGKEMLATFDSLWARGDEARLEKLVELKNEQESNDEKDDFFSEENIKIRFEEWKRKHSR